MHWSCMDLKERNKGNPTVSKTIRRSGRILERVELMREGGKEVELSAKTKERKSERKGRSEHKFRLIIRLGNTCQVSTAYILLEVPCSIRGSGVSSIKCSSVAATRLTVSRLL